MQWLTAILAFATTMLVFSLVVSGIVETFHRVSYRRSAGLKRMIENFYDQVLEPHLKSAGIALKKKAFVDSMTRVRAPTSNNFLCWFFPRVSELPTETFMERLGSSDFSQVVAKKIQTSSADGEQLLKDIAQKYETMGAESSEHFQSWARLWSMLVAMLVAWAFYVHPYSLLQTYMKNPEVAGKVAAVADGTVVRYEAMVKEAKTLQEKQSESGEETSFTSQELADLFKSLKTDIENAKTKASQLSQLGAPIGWPSGSIQWRPWRAKKDDRWQTTRSANELDATSDGDTKQQQSEDSFAIYFPKSPTDGFWLLLGGILIGLGAPFWANLIGQLGQAKNISSNLAEILKPQTQPNQPAGVLKVQRVAPGTPAAADEIPVTSAAFMTAAKAKP